MHNNNYSYNYPHQQSQQSYQQAPHPQDFQQRRQRQQSRVSSQKHEELILSPPKLVAFDSQNGSDEYYHEQQSKESTTASQMHRFLCHTFTFQPTYFEMTNSIAYKADAINLVAEDFLPSVKMDSKVIKKMQSLLRDGLNKKFFLTGSSFESSSLDLLHQTFYLDKMSFDFEDSYERSFYGNYEYSVSCFCIGDPTRNPKPTALMHEQLLHAVNGVSSFQGIDVSEIQEYQYRRTDLLYLNHFRIFLFFEAGSASNALPFKLHRYLYYPRIDFAARLISQPFRLVSTPLMTFLAKKTHNTNISAFEINQRKTTVRYGFLSLDQSQRLLPFLASDNSCVKLPLIGVWTYGIEFSDDESEEGHASKRFIWSLLTEFVKNSNLAERFSFNQQSKAFLLAVFNLDKSARYYEVTIADEIDSTGSWCMIKNYNAEQQSQQQQQMAKNYQNIGDASSKLPAEYPFRYSSKLVITSFDDETLIKGMLQSRQLQQQQQQQQQLQQQQLASTAVHQQLQQQQYQQSQIPSSVSKATIKKGKDNLPDNRVNSSKGMNNNYSTAATTSSNRGISGGGGATGSEDLFKETVKETVLPKHERHAFKEQIQELQKREQFAAAVNNASSTTAAAAATFDNNQTFAQNTNPSSQPGLKPQQQEQQQQQQSSSSPSSETETKISPIAEKIIKQQQEQIDRMAEQIKQLQEALVNFQQKQSAPSTSASQVIYPSHQMGMPPPPGYMYNYPVPPYYYNQYHPQYPAGAHPYPPMPGDPYAMYARAPQYMHESYISGVHQAKKSMCMDSNSEKSQSIHSHANVNNKQGSYAGMAAATALNQFQQQQLDSVSDVQSIRRDDDIESDVHPMAQLPQVLRNLSSKQQSMNHPEEQLSFAHNNIFVEPNRSSGQQSYQQQQQQHLQESHHNIMNTQQIKVEEQLQQLNLVNQASLKSKEGSLYEAQQKQYHGQPESAFKQQPTQRPPQQQQQQQQFSQQLQPQHRQYEQYEPQNSSQGYFQQESEQFVQSFNPSAIAQQINKGALVNPSFYTDQEPMSIRESSRFGREEPDAIQTLTNKNVSKQSFEVNALEQIQKARLEDVDAEEQFTIDGKSTFKMQLDFLNSCQKADEKKDSLLQSSHKPASAVAADSKKETKSQKSPGFTSQKPSYSLAGNERKETSNSNHDNSNQNIPTIKYEQYCDDSDSSDDEIKNISKNYV